jgi:hypothetical protein
MTGHTPTRSPHNSRQWIKNMLIVYKELINGTINKLSLSLKKSKKPVVSVNINGHIIIHFMTQGQIYAA